MARCFAHRQARDCHSLAPGRFSPPLDPKMPQEGSTRDRFEDQAVDKTKVASVGLTEVLTAPASPRQNAHAERVIGTIKRECLDHTVILGEPHLRRTIRRYVEYYNRVRTHLSLEKGAPKSRLIQCPASGAIRSRRHCGGLHHEYFRQAA